MAVSSSATRAARKVRFLKLALVDNCKPILFHDGVDVGATLFWPVKPICNARKTWMTALAIPQKTEPNEAGRRRPNDKKKGEQPGINVATASDQCARDDQMERNHPGFDQFAAERFVWLRVPAYRRQRKQRKLSKRNEFDRSHENDTPAPPPRCFNQIIEVVLFLSKLGRLRFQTCELAINAIENSNNEREQRSGPKIPAGIKQRHAYTEDSGSERDLI
jgi:hypothetical protein